MAMPTHNSVFFNESLEKQEKPHTDVDTCIILLHDYSHHGNYNE